ncbi:MAG: hypothetical protein ACR2PL_16760 [Dehalococcoidia bacterium]
MLTDHYVTDKVTGTFGDVLLATGLAVLLESVFDASPVTLRDTEGTFLISLGRPLDERDVEAADFQELLPYLLTQKNRAARPPGTTVLDYEVMKQKQSDYWAQRRLIDEEIRRSVAALSSSSEPDRRGSDGDEIRHRWQQFWQSDRGVALNESQPPMEWPVYQAVNQMSAIAAYNGAVQTWAATRREFQRNLDAVLMAFASSPNELLTAESEWRSTVGKLRGTKLDITWSQVFNPSAGKGQNRTKMDGAAMANSSGFWLWEYLKFVGAKEILAPRTIQSTGRTKDRKSYVLAPAALDVGELRTVARAFHQTFRPATAVKMDISGVLALTLAILDHLPEMFEPGRPWNGWGPEQAVHGLHTTYYKYLGTSAAVMNLSFLSVPRWMHIGGSPDIKRYKGVLQEHQVVVQRIEEERSEGYELLRTYRDFLSEGSIWPLLDFCVGYGAYLMSDWERRGQSRLSARQLTVHNLEEVILGMDKSLSEIVSNEGFKAIAYAIRRSTVTPQYQKSRKQQPKYEIRYGLGTDLMRKANYSDEFAAALAEFVQAYNAENAQKAETHPHPPYRRNVRTEDLAQVLSLIDQHGARLVGSLLVAFGYSTERSEPAAPGIGAGGSAEADDGSIPPLEEPLTVDEGEN